MKWAWNVGRLAGIQIKVHFTFLFVILWAALTHWYTHHQFGAMLAGVAFVLTIFGCVLLHELGHALAARRFGIKTRDITLLPIGGLARLEHLPDKPTEEIIVALAGPAVNVLIAGVLLIANVIFGIGRSASEPFFVEGTFVERLILVNIFLVIFNLLPAFPMDGGRIVRGLLATRLQYAKATRIAACLGQTMAILFAAVGFFFNPMLVLIGVFVWIGASQETSLAEMRSVLGGARVENAMLTDYIALSPSDRLGRAVDLIIAGSQEDFPVVESGHVVGVLTRHDLVQALTRHGKEGQVAEAMRREFRSVEASEMLENVVTRMQVSECRILPVTRFGELVGLITLENIRDFISLRSALSGIRQTA